MQTCQNLMELKIPAVHGPSPTSPRLNTRFKCCQRDLSLGKHLWQRNWGTRHGSSLALSHHTILRKTKQTRFSRVRASKAIRNTAWQELHSLFYAHHDFLNTDTYIWNQKFLDIHTYFLLTFIILAALGVCEAPQKTLYILNTRWPFATTPIERLPEGQIARPCPE